MRRPAARIRSLDESASVEDVAAILLDTGFCDGSPLLWSLGVGLRRRPVARSPGTAAASIPPCRFFAFGAERVVVGDFVMVDVCMLPGGPVP